MKPQRTQSSSHQSKTCPEDKPPAWVVFARQKMKRWFCFPAVPQRKHPREKMMKLNCSPSDHGERERESKSKKESERVNEII